MENGLLRAVVWGAEWTPRLRFEASCEDAPSAFWGSPAAFWGSPGDRGLHPAPAPDCSCGIYAFKRREDADLLAREKAGHDLLVLGRVSLWGHVVESERGYRGEFAYPYDLEVLGGSEPAVRELRSRYAVDVSPGPAPIPLHTGRG